MGFFDPEYQNETYGSTNGFGPPVVSSGKHVIYREVHTFVSRLEEVSCRDGNTRSKVEYVIPDCLRGAALVWYLTENTESDRMELRNRWDALLIKRFGTNPSTAMSLLSNNPYSLENLRNGQRPRAWINQMMLFAKSASFTSLETIIALILRQLDVELVRTLNLPGTVKSVKEFLEKVDSKTRIWEEMAYCQDSDSLPQSPLPQRYESSSGSRPKDSTGGVTPRRAPILVTQLKSETHNQDPYGQGAHTKLLPVGTEDGDEEYRVERLVGKRWVDRKPQYLVKWSKYGDQYNEWYNSGDLQDCWELVQDYNREHPTERRSNIGNGRKVATQANVTTYGQSSVQKPSSQKPSDHQTHNARQPNSRQSTAEISEREEKPTPDQRQFPQQSQQSQQQNFPQNSLQSINMHMPCFHTEELGTFDPDLRDVYSFVERINEVTDFRGAPIVQTNIFLALRGKAKTWYEMELSSNEKANLRRPSSGINAWTSLLISRFRLSATEIKRQLANIRYTLPDAAAGKDPVDIVYQILRLTRERPVHQRLEEAFIRFDPNLQVQMLTPTVNTTIEKFIKELDIKKFMWWKHYAYLNQKKDHDAPNERINSSNDRNRRFTAGPDITRPNNVNPYRTTGNNTVIARQSADTNAQKPSQFGGYTPHDFGNSYDDEYGLDDYC